MDMIFPSRRRRSSIGWYWHSIRKACAGAASSIDDSLGGDYSHDPRDGNGNTSQHLLPPDHPQTIRVRRIAAHLIATACECDDGKSGFGSLFKIAGGSVDWRVDVVVDNKVLYARSNYKGILTVSTGILKYMHTDAQVAGLLGHEVAHVMARHGLKTRRNMFWVRFLVNLAAELLNVPRDRFTEDNWEFIFQRPWYFRKEYEADHLGLLLVAATGYDPRIVPKVLEKLQRFIEICGKGDDDNVLWSTHPALTERIRRLSQAEVMGEALDLYRQAFRSGKGKDTEALDELLDSLSWTLTVGLCRALFWAQERLQGKKEWLQGVPNHLWNSWLQEVHSKKEWLQGVPNHLWNSVRNPFISSRPRGHQVVPEPANWRSQSLQEKNPSYASGCWQLQRACAQGNTGSPCATLLWNQSGGAHARPEVKLFIWQLSHKSIGSWLENRPPH